MFLSSLVLKGFKSYSERVEVNFSPKIAVIIGSNGVGKSNALEGIAWALGEDDLNALRCRNRMDLFFGGSQITAPADEASIELTFENSSTRHRFCRCLSRSGKEVFMVNDTAVSGVPEYQEALNSIGVPTRCHNVIRQEELTDFFVKPPSERRHYLQQYIGSDGDLERVNNLFDEYIQALLPGSRARIVNWNGEVGPDLEVTFPDKGVKWGVLLSGGERAVTALALKLALFNLVRSPMFMMDEVEPSMDWTRNHNMQGLLKKISQNRQLIMVTHFQSTIQMADTVHGVRIRPDGSSWLKFHFLMDERLFKIYKCC
ncbi:MAG: AAA family ATPase [Desulfomonile tiedjei]|uniref:AAA family ATPase n=1 Tax=Desulfomonile tiedjei TaxID=2358 RepID=A0A9D6VA26_9BACT|nr:AAA family ATPase [Desulfomonile tiedjei]